MYYALNIHTASTHDDSFAPADVIAKKSLNKLCGHRQISIQEAVHEISSMDLVICSDHLTELNLSRSMYLRENDTKPAYSKSDLVGCYKNRPESLDHLSLERYFYDKWRTQEFYKDEDTERKKYRILLPKGLNCRPKYPADYDYARGMILMHVPWSCRNTHAELLMDKDKTIAKFRDMIGKKEFPIHVQAEYNRAVTYSETWVQECIAKSAKSRNDRDLDEMDDDELAQHEEWEHSRHISAQNTRNSPNLFGDLVGDIGRNHDWSVPFYKGKRAPDTMEGTLYTEYLKEVFYGDQTKDDKVVIPRNRNGQHYDIEDMNKEQQTIVICAMEAVVKFLTNDSTYKPLRATVVGCGGTGKSFVINTLVSIMRRYTKCNDSIKVAAPSGGAAYNVGGCTLHRCLKLSVKAEDLSKPLNDDKQTELSRDLRRLLMLIVDERSMLNSGLIAGAERNIRHCVFGQQNQNELWGGIPVVLIFGDDLQLLPVKEEGAVDGYAQRMKMKDAKPSKKSPDQQITVENGHELFINGLTEDVFNLTENYRTRGDPDFKLILDHLRVGILTESEGERLMAQCMHHHNTSPYVREYLENHPKTVWLYTTNQEKNEQNMKKLVQLSRKQNVPIARLKCEWSNPDRGGTGLPSVIRSHFHNTNLVVNTDICVGSIVAINGINIVPEAGLYNGARGKIIDIKYDTGVGPNDKHNNHLPKYVVVDFPGLRLGNAEPWDSNNPTVSSSSKSIIGAYCTHITYCNAHLESFSSACSNTNADHVL